MLNSVSSSTPSTSIVPVSIVSPSAFEPNPSRIDISPVLFGSENSCSPSKRPHTEEAIDSVNKFETINTNPEDTPVTENRQSMTVSNNTSAGNVATESVEGIVLVNVYYI